MRHPNDNSFAERRKAAESAKRQLIARFASAPKPSDPEMQERLAAREEIAFARTARRVERDAMKVVENDRLLSEVSEAVKAAELHQRAEAELAKPTSTISSPERLQVKQPAKLSETGIMPPARLVAAKA